MEPSESWTGAKAPSGPGTGTNLTQAHTEAQTQAQVAHPGILKWKVFIIPTPAEHTSSGSSPAS